MKENNSISMILGCVVAVVGTVAYIIHHNKKKKEIEKFF